MKIPDHELVCRIGQGSYGEVWLARSVMGTWRAAKFVFRKTFRDQQPFQRELAGIQRFEPVSRSHAGFVHVLHVGRNEQDDYFYYLMELADDAASASPVVPETYQPKTLSTEITRHGRLPLDDCLKLALRLTSALGHLHEKGLVHRDIKPSNIVFVEGEAKLADIGLVTGLNEARSYVGTEGFIPPEGPGSPQADIYSLGKSLYEALTGNDRQQFPELPNNLGEIAEPGRFLELNEIIVKACDPDRASRYQDAGQMLRELKMLEAGGSVRTHRRRKSLFKLALKTAAVLSIVGTAAYTIIVRETERRQAAREASHLAARNAATAGILSMNNGRSLEALPEFIKALEVEKDEAARSVSHRMRIQAALTAAPKLTKMWFTPRAASRAEFNFNGSLALIVSDKVYLKDTVTGQALANGFGPLGLTDAAFSPEGARVLTVSARGAALWDLSGRQTFVFAPTNHFRSGRFSRDGSRIVTAGEDGKAAVWTDAGALVHELRGHAGAVLFADFSHDGAWIVTCGKDGRALLWNAKTGERVSAAMQHGAPVCHASFSPDSRRLATACLDQKARLWRCPSGEDTAGVMPLAGPASSAQFSPDGLLILTAAERAANLWSSLGADVGLAALPNSGRLASAAFDRTGRRVLIASSDGSVRLWDLAKSSLKPDLLAAPGRSSAAPLDLLHLERGGFPASNFLSNALRLRLRGNNKILRASPLNAHASKPAWEINLQEPGHLENIWLSDHGDRVANALARRVDIHSVSNILEASWPVPDRVQAVAFDRAQPRVAIAAGQKVYIHKTGADSAVEIDLPAHVFSMSFTDDGSLVTCLSASFADPVLGENPSPSAPPQPEFHTVIIWDPATGQRRTAAAVHNHNASGGYSSANAGLLLTVNGDQFLRVWDVFTGQPASLAAVSRRPYSSINFLPDGKTALAIEGGGSRIWRWQFGADKHSLEELRALRGLLCDEWDAPERGTARIQKAWQDFSAREPQLFRVDSRDVFQWHAQMARGAMAEENWPGALLHLEILIRLAPNHPGLAEDLNGVRSRLKK